MYLHSLVITVTARPYADWGERTFLVFYVSYLNTLLLAVSSTGLGYSFGGGCKSLSEKATSEEKHFEHPGNS